MGYDFAAALDAMTRGDNAEALAIVLPNAEAGNSDAQCMLALMYESGFGVARDASVAEQRLLRASAQGNPVAWNHWELTTWLSTEIGRRLARVSIEQRNSGSSCASV